MKFLFGLKLLATTVLQYAIKLKSRCGSSTLYHTNVIRGTRYKRSPAAAPDHPWWLPTFAPPLLLSPPSHIYVCSRSNHLHPCCQQDWQRPCGLGCACECSEEPECKWMQWGAWMQVNAVRSLNASESSEEPECKWMQWGAWMQVKTSLSHLLSFTDNLEATLVFMTDITLQGFYTKSSSTK